MQEQISLAIRAFLDPAFRATYPSTQLVWPNAPFDWNMPPSLFVEVELEFDEGHQVGLSKAPRTRLLGYVRFVAYARVGEGALGAGRLLDWCAQCLAYQRVGTVQFQAPKPEGSSNPRGFHCQHLRVNFYSDPV